MPLVLVEALVSLVLELGHSLRERVRGPICYSNPFCQGSIRVSGRRTSATQVSANFSNHSFPYLNFYFLHFLCLHGLTSDHLQVLLRILELRMMVPRQGSSAKVSS